MFDFSDTQSEAAEEPDGLTDNPLFDEKSASFASCPDTLEASVVRSTTQTDKDALSGPDRPPDGLGEMRDFPVLIAPPMGSGK